MLIKKPALLTTVLLSSVFFTSMAFAMTQMTDKEIDTLSNSGGLQVKNVKVKEATAINGAFIAVDSVFKQDTSINGKLDAKDVKFDGLNVNGVTTLEDVSINGKANFNGELTAVDTKFEDLVTLNGNLTARESKFDKTLRLDAQTITLENCQLEDVIILKSKDNQPQKLILKKTKISGKVVFEGGNGTVQQDKDSTIKNGVTGATSAAN
jgi:cytoskeletal protein CcmA (bactofilin family)